MRDPDALPEAGVGLVHGVVHRLVDEVAEAGGAGGADVHPRAVPDGLDPLQDLDVLGGVALPRRPGRRAALAGARPAAGRADGVPLTRPSVPVSTWLSGAGTGGISSCCCATALLTILEKYRTFDLHAAREAGRTARRQRLPGALPMVTGDPTGKARRRGARARGRGSGRPPRRPRRPGPGREGRRRRAGLAPEGGDGPGCARGPRRAPPRPR